MSRLPQQGSCQSARLMAGLDSEVPSAVTSAVLVVVAGAVAEIVPVMVGKGVDEAVAVSEGIRDVDV